MIKELRETVDKERKAKEEALKEKEEERKAKEEALKEVAILKQRMKDIEAREFNGGSSSSAQD